MTEPRQAAPPKNWLLRKLARSTSTGNFLPEIDGLRCIAILSVIVFHIGEYVREKSPRGFTSPVEKDWLFRITRTGHIGVQLFFIISGFVVALPFANHLLSGGKRVDLRQYFLRRLFRIEPPYIIALIFWLLAFGFARVTPWPDLLRHFPASMFYLHNIIYRSPSLVLPPAWSLEIEIQFYLIAPILVRIFAVKNPVFRRGFLCIVILAIAIAQRWLRNPGQINGLHLEQEAHYFLIGLLLVDLHVTSWRDHEPRSPLLADLLATICVAALPGLLMHDPADQLLVPPVLAIMFAGMMRGRLWRSVLRNPHVYTIGGMCYTIYLYHGFFKSFAGHLTIRWQIGDTFGANFLVQAAMLIPIILVGSAVLFVLFEKPFMQKKRRAELLNGR
jgi:peptidoglycan/LPS O-acetylase OafA/YrhL